MTTAPMFPSARRGDGMYESFYLRAVAPDEPRGAWIRCTVHKRPGHDPQGSVWCTLFDARRPRPFQHKVTRARPSVPAGGWIAVGDDARLGPGHADGACGEASWSLHFEASEPELRHLRPDWLYRAPVPRTKLTSPAPVARFDGWFALAGERIELDGWSGMVGHNWGAEHAERWIWLHGASFAEDESAWLDIGLGRILVAGRLTPWIANGALSLQGRRMRVGGLLAPRPAVAETPAECRVRVALSGDGLRRGAGAQIAVTTPPGTAAGWRYADPDGGEHDVVNCSIAAVEGTHPGVTSGAGPGRGARGRGERTTLHTAHGGAYELGMRERDHGVEIAPFDDG
jgi:hypothetical protein